MQEKEQLGRITEKLQQLLRSYEQVSKENQKLRQELEEFRAKQEEYVKKMGELEQSIAVLRTISGNMEEADKKALEKQLNQYIREIDRCIALLGE